MGLIDKVNVEVNGSGDLLSTLSTYTTKILKPNIVDGKNILTQAMISSKNTKYVIKYDYELVEDITVPEGCILDFDGGSINGAYTVTGINTGIEAGLVKIFNTDVTLDGTWNVAEAYPEWFGAKGDGVTDDKEAIQKAIYSFKYISFGAKTYKIDLGNGVGLNVNKTVTLKGKSNTNGGYEGDDNLTKLLCTNVVANSTAITCTVDGFTISNLKIENSDENKLGFGIKHYRINGQYASRLTIEDVTVVGFDTGVAASSYLNLFTRLMCNRCNTGFCCTKISETSHADGIITSNNFRLCSFNRCSVGAILGGKYSSMINCTFDYNDKGLVINQSNNTIIGSSFEYSKVAFELNKPRNIVINSYHLIDMTKWSTYDEAAEYMKVTANFNTIDGIEFDVANESSSPLDRTSVDFKLLTIARSGGDYKNVLTIKGDVVSDKIILYKVLNNTNSIQDVKCIASIREIPGTNGLDFYVNTNSKCYITALSNDGLISIWNGTTWTDGRGFSNKANIGNTSSRPTFDTNTNKGFQYYDTSLNKPLWWNGTAWVDATGQTV